MAGKGEIVPAKKKAEQLRGLLEKSKAQFAELLPQMVPAERFMRAVMTECGKNPVLLDCTPTSVMGCVATAAHLGLEYGPLGHAYMVPFRNNKKQGKPLEATHITGYKGLLEMARQSGKLDDLYAEVVYEKDDFDFQLGTDRQLSHQPAVGERGKPVFVYAVAVLTNGQRPFVVMSEAEVLAIKKRSRAASSGPWVTDEMAMWKKTVVRQLCKWLPLTPKGQLAVAIDEQADAGLGQDLIEVEGIPVDPSTGEAKEPEPALEVLAQQMEGENVDGDNEGAEESVHAEGGKSGGDPEKDQRTRAKGDSVRPQRDGGHPASEGGGGQPAEGETPTQRRMRTRRGGGSKRDAAPDRARELFEGDRGQPD